MHTKVTTLRMPESMSDELAAVARTEGEPVSEIVRAAIENEMVTRRSHPTFQKRRKQMLEKDVKALKSLGPPEED
jgi:ribbon-helix-helix CopG family protein